MTYRIFILLRSALSSYIACATAWWVVTADAVTNTRGGTCAGLKLVMLKQNKAHCTRAAAHYASALHVMHLDDDVVCAQLCAT